MEKIIKDANPANVEGEEIQPKDKYIQLPNGIVMIKPEDPNLPETLIMPPEPSKRSSSHYSSDTEDI